MRTRFREEWSLPTTAVIEFDFERRVAVATASFDPRTGILSHDAPSDTMLKGKATVERRGVCFGFVPQDSMIATPTETTHVVTGIVVTLVVYGPYALDHYLRLDGLPRPTEDCPPLDGYYEATGFESRNDRMVSTLVRRA